MPLDLNAKCLLFLLVFQNRNVWENFSTNSRVSNVTQMRPDFARDMQEGGRTDGQTDGRMDVTKLIINRFSHLYCKSTYKAPESTLDMQLYTTLI